MENMLDIRLAHLYSEMRLAGITEKAIQNFKDTDTAIGVLEQMIKIAHDNNKGLYNVEDNT